MFYTVYTTPPKALKPETNQDVNRIVIQEMVNDIIDKTKDAKTAAPSSTCNSEAKVDESILKKNSVAIGLEEISVSLDAKPDKDKQNISLDANSNSKIVDKEKQCIIQKETESEEIKAINASSQNESLNDTDIHENTSLSEKVIESTSDDSGNFSLNDSFENSVSDISKSESDDTTSTHTSKDVVKVRKDGESKDIGCKEKTDENMNTEELDVHDEVFHETKLRAVKSKCDIEETLVGGSEDKNSNSSNVNLDNPIVGERLIEECDKKKADKTDEHNSVSETIECSTSTSDLDTSKAPVSSSVHSRPRLYGKDDLVSEPIVSSTQNTQGCQTDDGESETPKPMDTSEKEDTITTSSSDCNRLRIDVSCETENLEVDRQMSRESVSVSTDTEELTKDISQKRKSVDSATSTDIPYKSARRGSVDSGTYAENQDKAIKPLSPRKLSPHRAGKEVQPLSPTKITLKLASPPIAVKRPNQSPSRSDPTSSTFLSQFESFVNNELPDTSQDYEPPYTTSPRPATGNSATSMKALEKLKVSKTVGMKPDSSEKKPVPEVTSKRPRGRPPKNKTSDTNLVTKHKTHKSRSSSPKYLKYERQKSESFALGGKSEGKVLASDCSEPKRRKHNSEKSETHSATQQEERKIPKHFVLFSNGKYTLATENNISKFKQSSPVSPTRTVWDTVLSSYGDKEKHKYSKSAKSNSAACTKTNEQKADRSVEKTHKNTIVPSQETIQPKLKPLRIVISEPLPILSKSFNQGMLQDESKKKASSGSMHDYKVSNRTNSDNVSYTQANSNINIKTDSIVSNTRVTDSKSANTTKDSKSVSSTTVSKSLSTSSKTGATTKTQKLSPAGNSSKSVNTTHVSKPATATSVSKATATTSTIPPITVPSFNYTQSKDLPSPGDNKPIKAPEYRHQSPFFASLSGAKLTSPHRPSAHLNIPNLNSHFAGTHYLYAQNNYRYTNDRLGCPPYRSLPGLGSAEAKAVGMGMGSAAANVHRDISTSHSAMMSPFISPLAIPSMLHMPATQALPFTNSSLIASTKGHSPDSTRSHIPARPDIHHAFNIPMTNMSNIKSVPKQVSTSNKKKEKSIDNVISAITEMRAKKEVSLNEQLTGMDLSTKNRNSPMSTDKNDACSDIRSSKDSDKASEKDKVVISESRDKIKDKYAFTDEDEVPSKRPSLHVK